MLKYNNNGEAKYSDLDIQAMGALKNGLASEGQQKRAFNLIVNELSAVGGVAFDAENPHNTSFLSGRRSIGVEMLQITQTKQRGTNNARTTGSTTE